MGAGGDGAGGGASGDRAGGRPAFLPACGAFPRGGPSMILAFFVPGPRFQRGTFHDFGPFRARSSFPEGDLP